MVPGTPTNRKSPLSKSFAGRANPQQAASPMKKKPAVRRRGPDDNATERTSSTRTSHYNSDETGDLKGSSPGKKRRPKVPGESGFSSPSRRTSAMAAAPSSPQPYREAGETDSPQSPGRKGGARRVVKKKPRPKNGEGVRQSMRRSTTVPSQDAFADAFGASDDIVAEMTTDDEDYPAAPRLRPRQTRRPTMK